MSTEDLSQNPWVKGTIEQNRQWLLTFLYSVTGDYQSAEDLAQETFQIALRKSAEYDATQPFGGWLRGIARNLLKRHLEKNPNKPLLANDKTLALLMDSASALESAAMNPDYDEERKAVLQDCVKGLADKYRRILDLHYGRNSSLSLISAELGVSVSNAGVMLFRAREALADCMRRKLGALEI